MQHYILAMYLYIKYNLEYHNEKSLFNSANELIWAALPCQLAATLIAVKWPILSTKQCIIAARLLPCI